MSFPDESCDDFQVSLDVVALIEDGTVPFEAVSIECPNNGAGCASLLARRIDVLHTQEPASALRLCLQVTRQCRQQRAEMERAGWRRCKPPRVFCRTDSEAFLMRLFQTAWTLK
jgi:hypothetical protein